MNNPAAPITILLHSKTEDPFARIPKTLLNDASISWKAKGILSYLLGKKQGWKAQVQDIVNHGPDKESAVRSGLKELRDAGYAKLDQERKDGRFVHWILKVSDTPVFIGSEPDCDFPDLEKPDLEKPDLENRDLSKKEVSKKEESKNVVAIATTPATQKTTTQPGQETPCHKTMKPPTLRFSDGWCEGFKERFGGAYHYNGRDGKTVAELIRQGEDADELLELARRAWSKTDPRRFWKCVNKTSTTWEFAASLPGIRAELSRDSEASTAGRF